MARLIGLAALAAAWLAAPARAGLFPSSPFSDKAAGTTAAAFLKDPPSARAEGMGGAYAASASGSEALFWNPSGMASLEQSLKTDASMGYDAMLETAYQGSLAYAVPIAGYGVVGAGVLYNSQPSQQGYTSVGEPTASFTPSNMAFALGYAKSLGSLRAGGAVKVIRSKISDASGTAFAVDLSGGWLGAVQTSEGPIDLAVSAANLGPAMSIGGGSDPLPFSARLGGRWHVTERVAGVLEGVLAVDQDPYPALGLEAVFPAGEKISIAGRFGYNVAHTRNIEGLTGLTAGFGLEWSGLRLDYAWVPHGNLGSTNRVTLGAAF